MRRTRAKAGRRLCNWKGKEANEDTGQGKRKSSMNRNVNAWHLSCHCIFLCNLKGILTVLKKVSLTVWVHLPLCCVTLPWACCLNAKDASCITPPRKNEDVCIIHKTCWLFSCHRGFRFFYLFACLRGTTRKDAIAFVEVVMVLQKINSWKIFKRLLPCKTHIVICHVFSFPISFLKVAWRKHLFCVVLLCEKWSVSRKQSDPFPKTTCEFAAQKRHGYEQKLNTVI